LQWRWTHCCENYELPELPDQLDERMEIEYEMLGHSPDEIISSHPHLNLPQVHDALSFYYENRNELDPKAEQDHEFIARLKEKIPSRIS
jgi:hypothetical protein